MASDSPELDGGIPISYIFVRVLGSGAFGEAVLYQKTEDNSLVVWKEVNLGRLNEKQRRDSQNEIDILSFVNHANIISYYNHFVDEDTLFIEMEYANGGTLYDKVSSCTKLWPEKDVLWYLYQMTSALAYIHQCGVIHRDIKTLNIFLTKVGLVKLGDFGISRFLESKNQMAETLVGTPYYMSPEIMKGEKYNFQSDIWALGCVLYEMLTLSRTFQATNPLKLALDIVKSDHTGINKCYSDGMRNLVDIMLRKKPEERPTAEELLARPLLASSLLKMEQKVYELNSTTRRTRLSAASTSNSVSVVTSKMCEIYQWGGGKMTPQKLEMFTREKSPMQVAAGHCHFAAITFEKELYTWANPQGGVGMVGQLGHGDTASYKAPKRVDALLSMPVHQVACGEDFTLCVSDDGALYAFGSDYYGCLGCEGEDEEVLVPVVVDFFSDHPVLEVACGDNHVIALTHYRDVYTWGSGEFGRLGLGSEDDFNTPQKVDIPVKQQIKSVCAGSDSSFLLCSSGRLLACGSNQFNKLGFNSQTSGLRKRKAKTFDIPHRDRFSTVKPLTGKNVMVVAAGKTHSGVIDSFGHLYMFGSNKFGQLGVGDFKARPGVCRVGGVLAGQRVETLACGDGFTVASTNENQIYSWGNGESGRLGANFTDQGIGPNSMCTAFPRPIFGSMHLVSCMSCRHWNTLIIAEKVLNQKTLKSRVSSPKQIWPPSEKKVALQTVAGSIDSGPDDEPHAPEDAVSSDTSSDFALPEDIAAVDAKREFSPDVFTPPRSRPSSASTGRGSPIPSWLEKELNEAEVIPFPTPSPIVWDKNAHPLGPKGEKPSPLPHVPELSVANALPPIKSPDLKLLIPSNDAETVAFLTSRVAKLEEENLKLKQTVEEQAELIKKLRGDGV
ncbi:serine/threonine-protein kinase Nek9 [Aplysia californica]|uniref:non-specific serine/threonine protein kinase n=1 Tax=Aplysia californica TaxID=6500 RepID=A0ABM1ADS5_APLCA|nr:serine/threonine-protein kinase Nek9 [Aplysia californica]